MLTRTRVAFGRLAVAVIMVVALVPAVLAQGSGFYMLPDEEGSWMPPDTHVGRLPAHPMQVEIAGVGRFTVDPTEVEQHRPDVFQPGHLSVYDLIAHLGETGEIELVSRYDEEMGTRVIESINGESGWWYEARYAGGWFERNTTRMDLYPVKDGLEVRLIRERGRRLEGLYGTFSEQVERLEENEGEVIVPQVQIEGPHGRITFSDVRVTSHNVRPDLWQPGTITALDILLSLGEQGHLKRVGLQWYDSIGSAAAPVDNYFVELIEGQGFIASAEGGCGFVYEVGDQPFRGFTGNHVHIPTDANVIVSVEDALWFWICL